MNFYCIHLLSFFLLTILVSVSIQKLQGQTKPEKTSTDPIIRALYQQQEAWNKGDLETFMFYYRKDDSMAFVGKNGLRLGWQATFDAYRKNYPDSASRGKLNFEILRLEYLSKSTAYLVGKWELKRSNDVLEGIFTLVWQKVNGNWRIALDHTQ
jgi:ketosteroid isomerase-like protein